MYIPGLDQAVHRWWSRWVQRGRTGRARLAIDGSLVLTFTARYRVSIFLLFAGFSGLYSSLALDGFFRFHSLKEGFLAVASVLLWLLFTVAFVGSLIEQVTVTPLYLRRQSWRGRQEVAWHAVNLFTIDDAGSDVKIGVKGGTVIEVSFYLDGLNAIGEALQQHLGVPPFRLQYVLPDEAGGSHKRSHGGNE